ncbi:S-crystallin SL11-like [Octopus sinensis]|uniref:S-crystallin SL11-like n=1 Tax=Octopus sinensis TaxID=2607531 RepID=A0A6P7SF80_9MOLL|nr:S-crystallin SL11-like [Octopus sinensis]
MPSYTLYYFNGRGRAEICRFLFTIADIQYSDKRIEYSEWTQMKCKMPGSMLPVLELDPKTFIPQSMAISRYLAREFGFHGQNNLEMLRVDAICDCFQDICNEYMLMYHEKDPAKKEELRRRYELMCDRILPYLEKTLTSNNSGNKWFVGDKILMCDLMCYSALENPLHDKSSLLKDYPKLQALRKRVAEHPKIDQYIKRREKTEF